MSTINDRVRRIRDAIGDKLDQCHRPQGAVKLIAAVKTRTAREVDAAVAAGIEHIGENRVQEGAGHFNEMASAPVRHMIGRVQSNKIKSAAQIFDWIQTIDSLPLAERLDRLCAKTAKMMKVLVQVNTSGEITKSGVMPDEAVTLVRALTGLTHLSFHGLMTIGRYSTKEIEARRDYDRLHLVKRQLEDSGIQVAELSMGMSNDYLWAIASGATMIRVGTALFGERT